MDGSQRKPARLLFDEEAAKKAAAAIDLTVGPPRALLGGSSWGDVGSEPSIQILTGPEAVRRRPGFYGLTDEQVSLMSDLELELRAEQATLEEQRVRGMMDSDRADTGPARRVSTEPLWPLPSVQHCTRCDAPLDDNDYSEGFACCMTCGLEQEDNR
jgi:hypothetical protein